jgi:hypothetical protein
MGYVVGKKEWKFILGAIELKHDSEQKNMSKTLSRILRNMGKKLL